MKKILLLAFMIGSLSFAQEKVSAQVIQDAKLALFGDKMHGSDPGTLDVSLSIIMQGQQREYGYMIVYPEFEYADLQIEPYRRWTANVGYVFNQLIVEDLEMGASLSYGMIDRGLTEFCWGGNAFTKYKLNDSLKIVINAQITERPDLEILYKDFNEFRISGQIGIEFTIFEK